MIKICNAFSFITKKNGKVYWKTGMDSHNVLMDKFKLKDEDCCPCEISPKNRDYLNPDKWEFKFDDKCPMWWKSSHEKHSWEAFRDWKEEVYSKINLKKARNPINPLKIKSPTAITKANIELLAEWDSVRDSVWGSVWGSVGSSVWGSVGSSVWGSVRDSVGDSVGDSVRDSVWGSVWGSVGGSVGGSVRDSVWGSVRDSVNVYIGFCFKLKREEWKYTEKIKTKDYPFISLIKLWKQGLVPSFDGKKWRIHIGLKAKIIFEINKEDLEKYGNNNTTNNRKK